MVGADIDNGMSFFGSSNLIDSCDVEATLRIDEEGIAAIDDVAMTNCAFSPCCTDTVACPSALAHSAAPNGGEVPWRSAAAAEETATGVVSLPIAVCISHTDSMGQPVDGICEGVTVLTIDTGTTPYTVTADKNDLLGFGPCWIDGTWSLEGEPFTIAHLEG